MEKRLKNYISYVNRYIDESHSLDETNSFLKDLLIQISFFQHERLIHLLVTITFALLTFASVILCLFVPSLFIYILALLFIVLLIPYIRHYYILENGTQKLYFLYDKLKKTLE